jgi:hexulose-6-phosphate isomerase
MFPALNTAALDEQDPARQCRIAAAAGFRGIEFTVVSDGPLTPETPIGAFRELHDAAAQAGLAVVGVSTGLWFQTNYASPQPQDRQRALDLTLRLLDQAAVLGGGSVLVIPAVVGRATDPRPIVGYRDALNRTYEALAALRHEAEDRGAILALETVWNRFLLSPAEAVDLLDRVNSPNVGMYIDVGNLLAYGYPQDWIATLGRHVARVHAKDYDVSKPGRAGFCALGEGSVDWPAICAALREIGYDGPLTYEGGGEPAEIASRLQAIIAGYPPTGVGPP